MSNYNVEYNGKWACFSTISDGFITLFMSKEDYEMWYKMKYNTNDVSKIKSGMSMEDAIFSISLNRTREDALKCLKECGLPEKECEDLFYDMLSNQYGPIHIEGKWYECPNCGTMIDEDTKECPENSCGMEFYWD